MPKEARRAPKTPPRAQKTTPEHGHHDPSALLTFQSLRGHDRSTLPNDYECREALDGAAKPRSIGLVDASELQGAQNSRFGGVEAAILDTFVVPEQKCAHNLNSGGLEATILDTCINSGGLEAAILDTFIEISILCRKIQHICLVLKGRR